MSTTNRIPKTTKAKGVRKTNPRWGKINDESLLNTADQLQKFRKEILKLRFQASQWTDDWEVEIDGARKAENAIAELTAYLSNVQSSLFRHQLDQPVSKI